MTAAAATQSPARTAKLIALVADEWEADAAAEESCGEDGYAAHIRSEAHKMRLLAEHIRSGRLVKASAVLVRLDEQAAECLPAGVSS